MSQPKNYKAQGLAHVCCPQISHPRVLTYCGNVFVLISYPFVPFGFSAAVGRVPTCAHKLTLSIEPWFLSVSSPGFPPEAS